MNVRTTISALWAAMLLLFVYVDLFSLYRPDVRADIAAGEIAGFEIGGGFLVATTIYVAIPIVMIVATLVLAARVARGLNVVLSVVYAVTIVVGAIGEWGYYVLGSALELAALVGIGLAAWRWPRLAGGSSGPQALGDARPAERVAV